MLEPTLCWDCKKAMTGECNWSYGQEPVEGWEAAKKGDSYVVIDCPEFELDCWGRGTFRTQEEYDKFLRRLKKDMNKLTIIGNLVRDPELRTTTSGVNVCDFTVAVNRKKKAEGQPEADFFRVSAWRQLGENCAKWLAKGRRVCVVGPVSVRTYESNGTTRASLEVTAEDVEFLSGKEGKPQTDPATGYEKVEPADLPY